MGPIPYFKLKIPKANQSPILYGWYHNSPWARYNNYAYFWSEERPIRKTVVNHAQRVNQLREFGTRLDGCPGVVHDLSGPGPFTFFVPNNNAMKMIKEASLEKLQGDRLARFFRHHVLKGEWQLADLVAASKDSSDVVSLADQKLPITVTGSLETMNRTVKVAGAEVLKYNIRCWNGYVHIVDRPFVPRWR